MPRPTNSALFRRYVIADCYDPDGPDAVTWAALVDQIRSTGVYPEHLAVLLDGRVVDADWDASDDPNPIVYGHGLTDEQCAADVFRDAVNGQYVHVYLLGDADEHGCQWILVRGVDATWWTRDRDVDLDAVDAYVAAEKAGDPDGHAWTNLCDAISAWHDEDVPPAVVAEAREILEIPDTDPVAEGW